MTRGNCLLEKISSYMLLFFFKLIFFVWALIA